MRRRGPLDARLDEGDRSIQEQSGDDLNRRPKLPVETKGIRLMNRGMVKTIASADTGLRITLERVIMDSDGTSMINDGPETYTYLVPDELDPSHIKRGSVVTLTTDGSVVTAISTS